MSDEGKAFLIVLVVLAVAGVVNWGAVIGVWLYMEAVTRAGKKA